MYFRNTYSFKKDHLKFANNKGSDEANSQQSIKTTKISFSRRILKKQDSFSLSSSRQKLKNSVTKNGKAYVDIESLCDDNIALKCKIFELDEENLILKKRMMDLENELSAKSEGTERIYTIFRQPSLVSGLKGTIKELKEKLNLRGSETEELRAKIRNKRIIEAENEIKQQILACIDLKNQLEIIMAKRVISMDIREFQGEV